MSLVSRRRLLGAAIASGCYDRSAAYAQGTADKTLRIVDAIGNLPLTELGFELYTKQRPASFDRLKFDEAPAAKIDDIVRKGTEAPELLPDIVLVGPDRMVEGVHHGSWQELLPRYGSQLPDLRSIYTPSAWAMQNYADGHGLILSYVVTGPVLVHSPSSSLPTSLGISDLLGWVRANPGRFSYSRPTTSPSGRAFLTSLPYLLGDATPSDPVNGWDRTWSFLTEVGTHIDQYPLSAKTLIMGLERLSLDVTTCTFGDVFAARASAKLALRLGAFERSQWINDAHYAAIPKQVPPERSAAIVDVLGFMLSRPAQAFALRQDSMFPGPAIADATLEASVSDTARAADGADFAALTQGGAFVPPLFGAALPYALTRWDRQIRLKH